MYRVLFVCTGNLYRSPLSAALFLKKLHADGLADSWIVESAGTWTFPGRPIPLHALKAAREFGIELKDHRTRPVHLAMLETYDLILVMETGQREALGIEYPSVQDKVHLLSELADQLKYDIPDPAKSRQDIRQVIAAMSGLIDRAYPRICQFLLFREPY